MTKTVEEVRRAAFEAACPVPYYIAWNVDRSGYYSIHRDSTRKRGAECYDAKWQGFNAALDAVEIELPPLNNSHAGGPDSEIGPSYEQVENAGYNFALDDCRAAIEQTGLGLRIK